MLDSLFIGIGFTESLSVVIIGHWSHVQKLQTEHFNFSNDAARRNVLEFDSGSIKGNPCDQKLLSVKGLLSKLVSILTYKQQCFVKLFSSSACGMCNPILIESFYLSSQKHCHLCSENVYHLHSVLWLLWSLTFD